MNEPTNDPQLAPAPPTPNTRTGHHLAVARLTKLRGTGTYGLGAGGTNPNQATPFAWKNGLYCCDCIGAVLWALGCPRHHPQFPEYQGDINVDSALMDAGCIQGGAGKKVFFDEVIDPTAVDIGDITMFPSIRAWEMGDSSVPHSQRIRIGHTGLIAGWEGLDPTSPDPHKTPWSGKFEDLIIVECSGGWPAIKFGKDRNFHPHFNQSQFTYKGQSRQGPHWRTRVVTYHGPGFKNS